MRAIGRRRVNLELFAPPLSTKAMHYAGQPGNLMKEQVPGFPCSNQARRFRLSSWLVLLTGFVLCGCRPSPRAANIDPKIVDAMNRGVSLMGQYEYGQAVDAFEKAVAAAPSLLDAKVNLAIALFNRGRKEDMDRGTSLLDQVLTSNPTHLRALYFKGIVLQHIGNAEAAIACFEKVTQARPDDGVGWYLLGLCKQRVGRPAQADLLRAVELRPHLYSAYYQLYQVALRAGEVDQAKGYLEQFKTLRESPLGESIEMPQYNQMGELALVQPLPAQRRPPIAKSRYEAQTPKPIATFPGPPPSPVGALGGMAVGDLNTDGLPDIVLAAGSPGPLALWLGNRSGGFTDATPASGLAPVTNALRCSLGDLDNDGVPDLFVAGADRNSLWRGTTNHTFVDLSEAVEFTTQHAPGSVGIFLDADHDGDLDLFLCSAATTPSVAANRLWNNNGDGTFTNLAAHTPLECAGSRTTLVLPGDLDGDRDMDLVILREGDGARVFLNRLLGQYSEATLDGLTIRGDLGGALQDFNGDGALDLLVLGGTPAQLALFLGDHRGRFTPAETFVDPAKAIATWGPLRALRVADLDLDGDLDVACFGADGHVLWNDGTGRFVLQTRVWQPATGTAWAAVELLDVDGDAVPDLVALERGSELRLTLRSGKLTPPSSALVVAPTGVRSRDNRTRSPASGFGVQLTARTGLLEQTLLHHGLHGGGCQSLAPAVFGLGGAAKADYLSLLWPDGVAQVETALPAGPTHPLSEIQRKISSCPVLFSWNGQRFEFITDFAGVGGLGYFSAPGVAAPPQVLEHVKIEPDQLRPRDGAYELRVTEPMEESAYIDRLELLAVDHRIDQPVFPDERLAISGPAPTHELLVIERPILPVRAFDPSGQSCTDRIARVDRIYAYDPPLDRRYLGFCRPHTLELDFADRLAHLQPADPVFLILNGFIEYPYSQTVFAASQSRIGWEPIRVERLGEDGRWQTLVPDGGAPGGMARAFTIELTGLVSGPPCKLRLTTNLEIYYDQIFAGRHVGHEQTQTRALPLLDAELRRVGFAREYSPDGRLPLIYDYELSDASAPFHVLRGAYTRYGPVDALLREFDDRYVLVGPGDEIALRFDATTLPAPAAGFTRSFILVSHAYCKDMDLYTATPQTLEPLPFRAMSQYPYPATESFPDTPELQAFRREYNTRLVE